MYSSSPTPAVPHASPSTKRNGGFWIFGLCFFVAAFFFVYSFFWPEYQRNQLIKEGIPAEAVILAADPTGNVYNSQPEIRVRLRVSPTQGEPYEAETVMFVNAIYAPQFQPGKQAKVKYDPEDKTKVVIEETENGQR